MSDAPEADESKHVNAIGQPCVLLECPRCGHSEKASIGPTVVIGADFGVTVENIKCGKCDYHGPPGDDDGE